jgi:hypothetical protein
VITPNEFEFVTEGLEGVDPVVLAVSDALSQEVTCRCNPDETFV